ALPGQTRPPLASTSSTVAPQQQTSRFPHEPIGYTGGLAPSPVFVNPSEAAAATARAPSVPMSTQQPRAASPSPYLPGRARQSVTPSHYRNAVAMLAARSPSRFGTPRKALFQSTDGAAAAAPQSIMPDLYA